jgi:outer membrane protein assembly factor BamE (lipoprotein component of BamABCDE complex)
MSYYKRLATLAIMTLGLTLSSCNAKRFYDQAYCPDNQLTLGVVQKEIHQGMSQDEVAMVLGSPNIVTQDKDNRETWIYDKIATQIRASGSSGIFLFCQTGADYVARRDVSQQTLTVVIKFDEQRLIETISYHSSKF